MEKRPSGPLMTRQVRKLVPLWRAIDLFEVLLLTTYTHAMVFSWESTGNKCYQSYCISSLRDAASTL